jgi:hypothetical protein
MLAPLILLDFVYCPFTSFDDGELIGGRAIVAADDGLPPAAVSPLRFQSDAPAVLAVATDI